jgi:hypothetical protein
MSVFFLSLAIIGVAMFAMAIGVIFSNRCLRGSCGGPNAIGPDGQPLSCPSCQNNKPKSDSPQGATQS